MRVQARNRKHQSGQFLAVDQTKLYYQSWHPDYDSDCDSDCAPRAVIVIVHGLGAHSGIFSHLAEFLSDRQVAVYALDLRGHGRSGGQRGHINSWSEFRQDLNSFIQLVSTKEKDLPLYLLGQSLGGTISLDFALHYDFALDYDEQFDKDKLQDKLHGLILLSPALKVRIAPLKSILGKLFSGLLPRFTMDTGSQGSTIACDLQVTATTTEDPWRHTKATARLATEFWQTTAWIEAHASSLQIPLLILHGGADPVTLPETSLQLFTTMAVNDKERYEYPQGHHELQNDLECRNIFLDLVDWLERHLDPQLGA